MHLNSFFFDRLLGPDFLQLTNSLSSQTGTGHARVLIGNDDLRIFSSRPDEDLLDDFFPVSILVHLIFAMSE